MTPTRAWGGSATAFGLALVLLWTAREPGEGDVWRVGFVTAHLVATGLLCLVVTRWTLSARHVLIAAVALRVAVFPMLPALSDDGYRYIWDGVVRVEAGVSPYAHRPSDPALSSWQDSEVYARLNSPDYFSVYPPASQIVFSASATVYGAYGWVGSWYLLKLVLVALEVVAVALLGRAARPGLVALYALNPLVVLEVAGQGHTEAIIVFGLAVFVWGVGRFDTAGVLGAVIASLTKLAPAPLILTAMRRERAGGFATAVIATVGVTAWFWTPDALINAGSSLALFFGTLDQYALPYRALKAAAFPFVGDAAGRAASLTLLALWVGAVVAVLASDDGTYRAATNAVLVVIVGAALVTSTLHSWYFVPVLFVVPLARRPALRWSLVWLSAVSSVTYLDYVLEGTEIATMCVGWGGAAAVYAAVGHGDAASRTTSGVATRESIQTADG